MRKWDQSFNHHLFIFFRINLNHHFDSETITKSLPSDDVSFVSYGHLIGEAKLLIDSFVDFILLLLFFFTLGDKGIVLFETLLDMLKMFYPLFGSS